LIVTAYGSPESIEQARTLLERAFPALDAPETLADISAFQLQLSAQYRQLAEVVILVSLFLAGCSLAVSVAAGLSERKRPFSLLRLSGVPLAMLRRVVVLESAVPLLAAAAVSIVAGLLAAGLFVRAQLGYTLQAPGGGYYALVGIGIAASLGVIASTLPIIDRITGPETARNE
jgi:predicted lysophospholipase L1 biosynthesis ABC-type transport system permease subunit